GFRARFVRPADTVLITGVAVTDTALHGLSWAVRPQRTRLVGGMISAGARRYSLRGAVAGEGGGTLPLIDAIADVNVSDWHDSARPFHHWRRIGHARCQKARKGAGPKRRSSLVVGSGSARGSHRCPRVEAADTQELHPARRHSQSLGFSSRPHHLPPRRTVRRHACARPADQSRHHPLSQSTIRPVVRACTPG